MIPFACCTYKIYMMSRLNSSLLVFSLSSSLTTCALLSLPFSTLLRSCPYPCLYPFLLSILFHSSAFLLLSCPTCFFFLHSLFSRSIVPMLLFSLYFLLAPLLIFLYLIPPPHPVYLLPLLMPIVIFLPSLPTSPTRYLLSYSYAYCPLFPTRNPSSPPYISPPSLCSFSSLSLFPSTPCLPSPYAHYRPPSLHALPPHPGSSHEAKHLPPRWSMVG